ncbi:MAG TPA: aminodeoxychorismate synthase component I [Rhodocyclaceae bacterium]|nr:aminodeoxychorismate synthase component I [Rhodocyclaceae bacterium]
MLSRASTFALFDDNLERRGDLLLADLRDVLVCATADELDAAFTAVDAARARGCWVALAVSYELGYALEPRLASRASAGPLLTAWVFGTARHLTSDETERALREAIDAFDEHGRCAGVGGLTRALSQQTHGQAVARILDLIAAGDCYQVNYTHALDGELYGDPLALYEQLRRRQPVRFGAFVSHPDGSILSRSPELFVARSARRLVCRPMKGTAPRDADPAWLAGSEKNRAENLMIVDLIRNDLGRLAPAGGVRVERLFEIEAYPSVWQMTSTISAEPVDADLRTIFKALFPCGSITGAPKIRAMEVIHALEQAPRGLYCGALGWIAPSGDFRFSVPIRTLVAGRDGRVRIGIGSGIVADSDPADEWAESLLKARFVTGLQPSFGLIETLRCEGQSDQPYPLLERHLARLTASAAWFGFALDASALRSALMTHAASASGTQRVRIVLHPDGRFALEGAPLAALPAGPLSVTLAPEAVCSTDRLLRHKTTARALYDRELERAVRAGHFDVLFFNERGELTEGARSNVFIDKGDGVLHTPPLASGVLDGVFRRKLLDEGRVRETRLTRDDLRAARSIHVANALRGLLHVRIDDGVLDGAPHLA